ncbi:MAG: RHS repeat protein [Burkholderiales bacterium]|nr:RHS repeat protein [Burkholderiales bacterium]
MSSYTPKIVVAALLTGYVLAANSQSTTTYKYNSLGRLTEMSKTDGQKVNYDYDQAGNRASVANNRPAGGGHFNLSGGYVPTQAQRTGYVDVSNSGTQEIGGISAVCTGANWPITSAPTTIPAGTVRRYEFLVLAPGGNPCKLRVVSSNNSADNSPFTETQY